MLQQTRVAAVIPYYQRFLDRFPDFQALATAPEPELLAHWARPRLLLPRAQYAASRAADAGARQLFRLRTKKSAVLPGVGDYTAAAVSSIAYDLPHAALDGNVLRVLSRVLDERTNIASGVGRRRFAALAQELLDKEHPGRVQSSHDGAGSDRSAFRKIRIACCAQWRNSAAGARTACRTNCP